MATPIQITFDSNDPDRLADFWAAALGYEFEDPPPGFANWQDWLVANNVPEDEFAGSSLVDPAGKGPRIYFQKVPEGKIAKNRVHLDLSIGGGRGVPPGERESRIRAEAARLNALGATTQRADTENGFFWIVMQDPEGNEFCLN